MEERTNDWNNAEKKSEILEIAQNIKHFVFRFSNFSFFSKPQNCVYFKKKNFCTLLTNIFIFISN